MSIISGDWALAVCSWIGAPADFTYVDRTCDHLLWIRFANSFEDLVRKALFGLVVGLDGYNA